MIRDYSSGKISKNHQKVDDFRKNHSDMESELQRRLTMLRKKNLRNFLKQLNAL